ncbi:hypothetical protein EMIT0P265_180022 [Pseudomonas zeae]
MVGASIYAKLRRRVLPIGKLRACDASAPVVLNFHMYLQDAIFSDGKLFIGLLKVSSPCKEIRPWC